MQPLPEQALRDNDVLISPQQAADMDCCFWSVSTLAKKRVVGGGPLYFKGPKYVFYTERHIKEFFIGLLQPCANTGEYGEQLVRDNEQ
ncbi:MAG: hypothetical protein AAF512_01845 [Pseudomonadota bacterium]